MDFDIHYAHPVLACAAMFLSLETDLSLVIPDQGALLEYTTDIAMEA